MSHIISIAIAKGGVGKTTTTLHLGAGLAQLGKRVLLVDLDQQNHLSRWLGFEADQKPTISEVIYQEVSGVQAVELSEAIRHNPKEQIDYIPGNKMLGGIYSVLGADGKSNIVFRRIFRSEFFRQYDFILFDCPTAVDNLLVSNALECSDQLLLPVQAELLAYEGVPAMLEQLMQIKRVQTKEALRPYIAGMLLTMYDSRTAMGHEVSEALKESYGDMVFHTPIPLLQEARKSTEWRESLVKNPKSRVGQAYMKIAREIVDSVKKKG